MPASVGPNPSGDSNLVFAIDAADKKNSMLPFSTFLNMSSWTIGNGSVGGYTQNGSTAENERLAGTDPFGNPTIVWQSNPDGGGNADGGWNNGFYDIDRTKLYRWSVWVKRTSTTTGGTSYFGLYGSGGTFGVERLDGGGIEGNSYWECVNISAYAKDVWYLLVGHCYPAGTTGVPGNVNPDSGRYTTSGRNGNLNYCNIGGDVRWIADATVGLHRTYHYYCPDNTSHLQWFDPRFEVCDGTQPTIQDLLSAPPTYARSVIGANKGELVNGTTWTTQNGGSLVFDGTNDYVEINSTNLISGTNPFTIEAVTNKTAGAYGAIIGNYGPGYDNLWFATAGLYLGGACYHSDYSTTMAGWHYSAVTRDESGNVVLYRDGVQVNTAVLTKSVGTGVNWRIGADVNGAGEALTGNIPLVKTYNCVLTPLQIQQNYQQYKSRFNLS
jgi:hypothetical protein